MEKTNQNLAVAYFRVSTKKQEDEGYSLENQEARTLKYAKDNNLEIVKQWGGSESGWINSNEKVKKKIRRKLFNEMIEYVKNHKEIKHIIFYSQDRMTRNMDDYRTIETLRETTGLTVHFSQTGDKQVGKLTSDKKMFGRMKENFDEFFSDFISEKTSPAMEQKANTGVFPGCCPIGYLNNMVDKTIEVDNVRAPYIQELFQKVASENYSMKELTQKLYEQGLRSKKTGGKVSKATLYRTINNPFYYGEFYWKGVLHKGTHKPLVSKELWDKANEVLKSDRAYVLGQKFAFNGLLRCEVCGCSVSGAKYKKKKYTYYHCNMSKEKHKSDYISEEKMSEKLKNIVSDVAVSDKVADWLKKGLKLYAQKKEKVNKDKRAILDMELAKAEKELANLYRKELEDENMSDMKKEFYKKVESELEEKIKTLKEELIKEPKCSKEVVKEVEATIEIIDNLNKWYDKSNNFDKGDILKVLIHQSILTKDNKIIPKYKKPFNAFAIAKKLEENNVKLPQDIEKVIEDLEKKERSAKKSDTSKKGSTSSSGSGFSEWGG